MIRRMLLVSALVLVASLSGVTAGPVSPVAAAPATSTAAAPASPVTGTADQPHPFSVHDLLAMDRISDAQVSPDGRRAIFTLRETDLEANRGRTDLWLVELERGAARGEPWRLTTHEAGDWSGRWNGHGDIYFLSARSGSSQIWRIDPDGGEARQVTDLPLPVTGLALAPALDALLLSLEVYPGATIAETARRDEERDADPATGRVYDELMFRHWDTWEDGKRNHIFLLPLADPDADPVDLVPDLDADTPTFPWGGMEEVTVSPDGREIVFTAKTVPGSEWAWSTDYDLWAVAPDRPGELRRLTDGNPAWDTGAVFSPDGSTLAYLAMERPGYEADRFRIVLLDRDSGERRVVDLVHEGLELSPGSLLWSRDGKQLYCTAPYLGQRSIFAVGVRRGDVRLIQEMGDCRDLQLGGDRLVFSLQSLQSPAELYSIRPDGSDLRQITRMNTAQLARVRLGEPEQFTFRGWNDDTVYAYVVKPHDYSDEEAAAGRKWPVAFLVHGGPQGSFGNDFHYRWNPQTYVGAGFTTVAVDFHGSTGYGQEFTDAIRGHWGDRPLEDLEKGLAAALERYPWMDGDRVVAAGASYGGYMINWMHGQPFSRQFRAFVTHDGNLDERMAYFDTEELWFPEWEHQGTPWENPEAYRKHNPIEHVQNWHVPTLVVHGALDYRVVDTQGLSTFTALRRQGVPARLLYFPDENHWVLKPANSIQWHEEVNAWLTRWIE
ncbi:MAG: S9 family peptidase [Candidatus Krumholzibacteriia bacterium]